MKWILSMMIVSLMASCGTEGDFCDIANPITTTDRELGEFIVDRDRGMAKELNRHNRLVSAC